MPLIATLRSKAKIYVYADDHNPPHFNLRGPDTDLNIAIETFELLAGRATRVALTEAREWWNIEENRQQLRETWTQLNERD